MPNLEENGGRASSLVYLVLRNPVFANILMLIFLICGAIALFNMTRESFPQFDLDLVYISVPYPGAEASEVEESVGRPIEDALEGVAGIRRLFTVSSENHCSAVVEIDPSAVPDRVRDDLKTQVDAITTFPDEAEEPVISTIQLDDVILNLAIWGDLSERQLKQLAREVRKDLLALDGISRVKVSGVRDFQVSIELSEARLQQYHLSFEEVAQAVGRSSQNFSGGTMRTEEEDFNIRVMGRRYFAKDFGDIVVRAEENGAQVYLRDIAELRDTFDEASATYGLFNGERAVNLVVLKGAAEDSLDIAEKVRTYLAEKELSAPEGVHFTTWLDTSRLVQGRIDLLRRNGLIGLLLVFLSLWLFMELRLSFWVAMGIGVSISGAFALMYVTGQSINMISLFGLIMVLGIIVDDAIVVAESIYTRRENGEGAISSAAGGTREVAWPVLTAVTTSIVAFMPMLFISGIIGKFISVMPGPVMAALFISLFEALIILPVHLRSLPVPRRPDETLPRWNLMGRLRQHTGRGMNWFIERVYEPLLTAMLRWRYVSIGGGVAALCIMVGVIQGGHIKFIFFPVTDGDFINAVFEFPGGTPIHETEAATRQITEAWQRTREHFLNEQGKEIGTTIYANIGGTLGIDDGNPTRADHMGEVFVEMVPTEERKLLYSKILEVWRKETGPIPGVLSLKFSALSGGPPGGNIQLDLLGHDERQLVSAIDELKQQLQTYEGVFDINSDYKPGKQELRVTLKPAAEVLGVSLADIGSQLRAGFYGREVSRVQRGADEVKIMVRYTKAEREDLEQIQRLRIRTPGGDEIPLHHVAAVDMVDGFSRIRRENGKRKFTVTADTAENANSEEIMTDLLDNYVPTLAERYGIVVQRGFDSNDRMKSRDSVARGGAVAMLVIFLLMATVFKSYTQPMVIMFAIPFGIMGAVLGHGLLSMPLSMMSFFGFVALTGVVVNDAIVLIVAINDRLAQGMPFFDALREGGKRRFRAIVLTSLTTFAGLFPIILERSLQAQILIPMAVAIAFGVAFATIGTLLMIPCILACLNDIRCGLHLLWHLRLPATREEVEPGCRAGQL